MSLLASILVPHPPLIIHEVGRGAELKIEKTIAAYNDAMKLVESLEPETVVIVSPHSTIYGDSFHISPGFKATGDMKTFGSEDLLLDVSYDQSLVNSIIKECQENNIPVGTIGELKPNLDHATFVPLYFLNKHYINYKVVRISPSGLSPKSHYEFGKAIEKAIEKENKNIVLIISGDLSHKLMESGPYGFSKDGPVFDHKITKLLQEGSLNELAQIDETFANSAAECGLRPLQIMAGALENKNIRPELLSYEGPYGVGYAVATFEVISDSLKKHEDEYVKLAKESVEFYVHHNKKMRVPINILTDLLLNKGGTFVSIKENGRLRGCIGTVSATTSSLGQEIINNAVAAAAYDVRFSPIKEYELDNLTYSVDVLSEAEPINSTSLLDVEKYGIIVESGTKRGLLLPNLDGIYSVDQQIKIAKQKAGIREDEKFSLSRFTVERHQ